jgi:hypothetical protein
MARDQSRELVGRRIEDVDEPIARTSIVVVSLGVLLGEGDVDRAVQILKGA